MDHGAFRFRHRTLDCVQLGGQLKAGSPLLDHRHNATQMPFGAFQPSCDGWVACMAVRFCHMQAITP
jgi:hypothetical protein